MRRQSKRLSIWVTILVGLLTAGAGAQTVITPTSASDNGGTLSNRPASKSIDGSGLSGGGDILTQTHDSSRNNQWGASYGGNVLTYVLPGASDIDGVHIWNATEIQNRGLQSFDIFFSTDNGSTYPDSVSVSGFTKGGSGVQSRYFTARTGITDIELRNMVNYGDSYIYLPEIRFDEALAGGTPVLSSLSSSAITTTNAQVSAELSDADADVTVFWDADAVADPEAHTGWDGTNGPVAETTGTVVRTVSNLTADTQYTYAFYATNSTYGTESWSVADTFTTPLSDAQAPTFASTEVTIISATLAWNDNATYETGYILRRSTNSSAGPYTYIDAGNVTSYTDKGLSGNTTYYYALAATNSNDGSATSFSQAQTNVTTDALSGDVLAEYTFGGSVASSDADPGTTASDVTFAGLPDPENLSYLQIGAEEIGSSFPGGSGDYFTFTLDTGINEVSLTALAWDFGAAGGYNFQVGIYADEYLGFSGSGNYIPGTYASGGAGVNLDMTPYASDLSGLGGLQNLSNTSIVFRVYLADGASSTGREYRYDNIRLYGTVSTPAIIDIGDTSVSVSDVQTTQATVSATILNVDGDVTAYWEPGPVADPATYTDWDGTNGPTAETKDVEFDRVVSNLVSDTLYTYALFADDGANTDWASGTLVTDLSAGEAPVFTNASTSTYAISLGWEDKAEHETGYLLQRSTNGVDFTLLASLDSNTVSYVDYDLDPTVSTFYYRLAATNSAHGGSATDFALSTTSASPTPADVIAEYAFDGNSPSSSDGEADTDAAGVVLGAGISTSLRDNRIECAAGEVGTLNLGGSDYFGFTVTVPAHATLTLTHFTYAYEEANSYKPAHALWSDLTGEVTTPATRYQPGSTGLNGTRTLVHNLTEAGATFAGLSDTTIEFRLYMGDEASSTGEQRFDDVRLYGTVQVEGEVLLSGPAASSITTNSASLSVTLGGTNADVTAYWEAGVVADPAAHVGWGGTNGPLAATTGLVTRVASNLTADTLYTFAFFATNTVDGPTDWSAPATFVTALSDAQSPVFTSAVPAAAEIVLGWTDNASNETAYLLQWSTNDIDYTTLAPLVSNATSYTHTPLESGTTYYYQLAATNSANGSATTFSLARTNATTEAVLTAPVVNNGDGPTPGIGTATLSGKVVSGTGLTDVRIYFGDEDGGTNNPASWDTDYVFDAGEITEGLAFSTNVSGLLYGLAYSYRVYVSNSAGDAWSTVTNFTTLAPQAATGMVSQSQFNTATVTASDEFGGREPREAFDGTGLSGDTHTTGIGSRGDQWMSNGGGPASEWLKVNLGATYLLDYLKVWNWRDDNDSRGIQQCDIYVAAGDPGNNVDGSGVAFDPTGWTLANEDQIFSIGRGDGLPSDEHIGMGGVSADYMAIKVDSNYGDGNYTGLAEMQIYWTATAPIAIANSAAENITDQQADLVGTLDADGAAFTVTVYWSESNDVDSAAWVADGTKASLEIGAYTNVTSLAVTGSVASLAADTTYYYTMVASNVATNIWASSNASFDTAFTAAQAPVFTSAVVGASDIALGWTDNADTETGYILRRSATSDTGPWSFTTNLPLDATAYTDDNAGGGLVPGTTYYYQLAATNSGNGSATAFSLCATNAAIEVDLVWTAVAPATDPIGATEATAHAEVNLDLDNCVLVWDSTDQGANSIGDWTGSNAIGATNGAPALHVSAVLTGLSPDTAYTWRFYGTNSTYGKLAWSDPTSFVTALSSSQAPVFTRAESPAFTRVELEWSDNAVYETGYVLRRSSVGASGPWSFSVVLAANATAYTNTGVLPGTTYYYQLAATNSANGSRTDFALATTSAATEGLVAAF